MLLRLAFCIRSYSDNSTKPIMSNWVLNYYLAAVYVRRCREVLQLQNVDRNKFWDAVSKLDVVLKR